MINHKKYLKWEIVIGSVVVGIAFVYDKLRSSYWADLPLKYTIEDLIVTVLLTTAVVVALIICYMFAEAMSNVMNNFKMEFVNADWDPAKCYWRYYGEDDADDGPGAIRSYYPMCTDWEKSSCEFASVSLENINYCPLCGREIVIWRPELFEEFEEEE